MTFAVALSLTAASSAFGYSETTTTANPNVSAGDCPSCHATSSVSVEATGVARQGPHGGYTTTSRACAGCHLTHEAPVYLSAETSLTGSLLLPGETMTETCELCHDGTGGSGVYGTIAARGLGEPASAHRTEETSAVPGGDPSTGGTSTVVFSGRGGTLTCGDCHSAHGHDTVQPFTTDRWRTADDTAGFVSNQLLRMQPTGAATATAEYGSDWCAGCHAGRASGVHGLINHSVDTSATVGSGVFTYANVARVAGIDSGDTVLGPLGQSNFGYVMPWPRTAEQGGHSPICQQCHEDARNVGNMAFGRISQDEVFTITTPDGGTPGDNPRFQVFPHESVNASMLVETAGNLCTNCHHSGQTMP